MNKLNLTITERKKKRRYFFGLIAILAASSIIQVVAYFIDTGTFYIFNIIAMALFGAIIIYLDHKLTKLKKTAMNRYITRGRENP